MIHKVVIFILIYLFFFSVEEEFDSIFINLKTVQTIVKPLLFEKYLEKKQKMAETQFYELHLVSKNSNRKCACLVLQQR